MAHIDGKALAARVSDSLSLPVNGEQIGNSGTVELRVEGFDRPQGFSLRISLGLQMAFGELRWDTFSRPLMDSIASRPQNVWQQLSATRLALQTTGITTVLQINGAPKDVSDATALEGNISEITLRAQAISDEAALRERTGEVSTALLALVVGLLPLDVPATGREIDEDADLRDEFAVEGSHTYRWTSRYERSRANRAIAILLHGTECCVCGFDFGASYGQLGEGFVEIHHLTPVSQMAAPRPVDPTTELRPLCSNCHRMVHRKNPPIHPDELRRSFLQQ
jgi:5-methylcytosine-specific restriction protein A